jgi:hypothetical protein
LPKQAQEVQHTQQWFQQSQTPSTGEFCNKNLVNFAKTGEFGDKPLSHNLPQVIDLS